MCFGTRLTENKVRELIDTCTSQKDSTKKMPRKISPYMMFLEEIRPLIEMKFPGQTFAEISQIAALMWQKLTDDEKNEYRRKAGGGLFK